MSQNGAGSTGPPAGAVVLTTEMLELTSRKWVKLPFLSTRLASFTTEELEKHGVITAPEIQDGETEGAYAPRRAQGLEARAAAARLAGIWAKVGTVSRDLVVGWSPYIEGSEGWPTEAPERLKAMLAWRETLTPEARAAYDQQLADVNTKIVEAGTLTPKLAFEAVAALGDDASILLGQILHLSGMLIPVKAAEKADEKSDEGATPAEVTDEGNLGRTADA